MDMKPATLLQLAQTLPKLRVFTVYVCRDRMVWRKVDCRKEASGSWSLEISDMLVTKSMDREPPIRHVEATWREERAWLDI